MGPNPDRAPTRTGPQPGPGRSWRKSRAARSHWFGCNMLLTWVMVAQYELASLSYAGLDESQDLGTAISYLLKSANNGHARAQAALGGTDSYLRQGDAGTKTARFGYKTFF